MSISGAMNNAISGLRASGRAAEVVSANIANALTPGYGVRSLTLSSRSTGDTGGVQIEGIRREVDPLLIADRRLAEAQYGSVSLTTNFLDRYEKLLGSPETDGSLSASLSDFENALITATSRPDAQERLTSAVTLARDLANNLNTVSEGIQTARSQADSSIAAQVARLNASFENVVTLNGQIAAAQSRAQDASSLLDARQATIDDISEMIPVRLMERPNGSVAIYSRGGAALVDGTASTIEFTSTNIVTPYQTLAAGTLSGLTLNGTAIDTTSEGSPLRGGTLTAQFEVRDVLSVEAQSQIDAYARDLIERFADPAVDPTLAVGDPGLFTDEGVAFDPLNEVGISARISVNELVDPAQGGEVWRIRDGLGAVVPGNAGDSTILKSLTDTLSERRAPSSGDFGTGLFSSADLTASLLSSIGAERLNEEARLAFSSSKLDELKQQELATGVDSDAELQRLILIEQVYAANARIIETADDMLASLLRI